MVDNSVATAQNIGISQTIISMTIIAVGTALPEIVTSIVASIQGECDLILGNVTGSNLLNLGLLIGLGAIITPLHYDIEFNKYIILLMIATAIISIVTQLDKDKSINRPKGIILLLVYTIYLVKLFV